jgi:hypothetical protein
MNEAIDPGGLVLRWDIAQPHWFMILLRRMFNAALPGTPLRSSLNELGHFTRHLMYSAHRQTVKQATLLSVHAIHCFGKGVKN